MSNHWDEEADVIILGDRRAGAAAAIAAHDAGAKVGEGALSGVMAALANAVYDATRVRVTSLPPTAAKVLARLARSGPTGQFQMDVARGVD